MWLSSLEFMVANDSGREIKLTEHMWDEIKTEVSFLLGVTKHIQQNYVHCNTARTTFQI